MLPPLGDLGDLPQGVHKAGWSEIEERFGKATDSPKRLFRRLKHLHELAARTGKLRRLIVFGSFVTSVPEPQDVDIALVMAQDFRLEECMRESRALFSHSEAQARHGASVFWLREEMVSEQLLREFFEAWQIRRDGLKRGIVEVEP